MNGGKNKQPPTVRAARAKNAGYTIIEVMIVLAVSGVMFLIAADFINGKQARTSFTEGVNQMASNVQDVIEQVTDGQYSDIPLDCSQSGTSLQPQSGSSVQGTNSQCVFLGKVLHFYGSGTNTDQYEMFSIAAGNQTGNGVGVVTGLANAVYTPVSSLTAQATVPQSLEVSKVTGTDMSGAAFQTYAIGFLQSFGLADTVGNSYQSGGQTVYLVYAPNVTTNNISTQNAEDDMNSSLHANALDAAASVDICITDGVRYADITLGTNAGQLSANVKIDGTTKPSTC